MKCFMWLHYSNSVLNEGRSLEHKLMCFGYYLDRAEICQDLFLKDIKFRLWFF